MTDQPPGQAPGPEAGPRHGPAVGPPPGFAGFHELPEDAAAGRRWWDDNATGYLAEHGEFLGDADFRWCPEGVREADARLLGPVVGRTVLEVGCGAAQCSRWLAGQGATVVATDISEAMLAAGARIDGERGTHVPLVQADARSLPFAAEAFDLAFTAFGALPFVADPRRVHAEVARVVRPGGGWVFAVTHPMRWAFPDDPSERGLQVTRSYFDRRPYVETDHAGRVTYSEHHRTLGDHVADLTATGFRLLALVEPQWPAGHDRVWGGWGPVRGARLPGTAIFVCRRADAEGR